MEAVYTKTEVREVSPALSRPLAVVRNDTFREARSVCNTVERGLDSRIRE